MAGSGGPRNTAAVLAGVLTVIVLGGLSIAAAQQLWPGGYIERTTFAPRWYLWATVVVLTQFVSGILGGAVVAGVSRSDRWRIALYAVVVVLVVLAFPALWSADRPFEARWLLFVNLITAVGVPVGWFAVVRRRRPRE